MKLCPRVFGLLCLVPVLLGSQQVAAAEPLLRSPLAVVDAVSPSVLAAQAGMKPGDVVVELNGKKSPSLEEALACRFDQENAGDVAVVLKRGKEEIQTKLPQGDWGCELRVDLSNQAMKRLVKARDALKGDDSWEKSGRWMALADEVGRAGFADAAIWLRIELGKALGASRHWQEAGVILGQVETGAPEGSFWAFAASLEVARALSSGDDNDRAADAHGRATVLARASGSELRLARTLNAVFLFEKRRGRLPEAKRAAEEALAIQERLAPGSLAEATSLHSLGIVAHDQGDLEAARGYFLEALAIRERLAPDSLDTAASLNNMGIVVWNDGDLAAARGHFLEAMAIRERVAPDSLDVAASLNNLGIVAFYQGDLAAAEDFFLKSLAIRKRLSPGSLDVAASLDSLGDVVSMQGDPAAAREHYLHALEIRERLAPESLDVATSLGNLGSAARAQGDLTAARGYYLKALAIQERLSQGVGPILNSLGEVARDQGDLAAAREYDLEALANWERLAPGHIYMAVALNSLGDLAHDQGDSAAARDYHLKALAIRERLAPGTMAEAESLHSLGTLSLDEGDLSSALGYFQRAVSSLEAQKGKLGGGQAAAERFSAKWSDYYRDLVELQIRLDGREDAFATLERFRARSLLNMLAERDLSFARDVPSELVKEQKRADFELDRVQEQLGGARADADTVMVERLSSRWQELKEEQRQIREKIKAASPKLALLRYPEPLDVLGVTKTLEPGTLFLSYCVGKDATQLFALLDGKLSVHTLAVERGDLTRAVTSYRMLVSHPNAGADWISRRGQELYAILLQPAQSEIDQARRLLICPDGPLHLLPFSSLTTAENRYFIEEKPVSYAVSATVYSETKTPVTTPGRTMHVAAFGDPVYPSRQRLESMSAAVRNVAGITDLSPLPSTRHEVESIKALFEDAEVFLGARATEEEAKKLGSEAQRIHFACHAILDERFPLSSGLALTIPETAKVGKEDGLLQAWEVFEQLRVDADLVTLSACGTALGKEMGGEGLIGLTRAFHYAGARTVLSSLWSVADESTAELMKRFYMHLKEGESKTEALRLAQLSFIHESEPQPGDGSPHPPRADYSSPFYWAPFVLSGDWR